MGRKELICYSEKKEKILLNFFPCKNKGPHMVWEDWHAGQEYLTVYYTDYTKLLLRYLQAVFPLADPTNGELQSHFDVCFDNWIGAEVWNSIIMNIDNDLTNVFNNDASLFYREFIDWIEQQLTWADMIVVEGNQ